MNGVNRVILIGNLGKDPEVRTLETGVKVANFPLATTETYKNKNGDKVDVTEWHNIVLWRGLAEIAEKYLNKGNQIYVEGKLRTRSWDDKDGNKRYITEVMTDNLTMLGGGKREPNQTSEPKSDDTPVPEPTQEDDLPF